MIRKNLAYSHRTQFTRSAWHGTFIGLMLAAMWAASGCGGYHNPMTSTKSGSPTQYPASPPAPMHRTTGKK